jgi:hypothetical protein
MHRVTQRGDTQPWASMAGARRPYKPTLGDRFP